MKEKILIKATDMFLNYGFKSVTMDAIAKKLGISKKTIYAHYSNKTNLVEDSAIQLFKIISDGIDHICQLNKNPIEELYEIKKFVLLQLKDEKSSPQYQLQKYYPQIHNLLRNKKFEVMQNCVLRNLKKGIELHIYRANINTDFVSRIYFSGITSIKDQRIFPLDKFQMPTLMNDYLEYHLRGIITPLGQKVLNKIINSNQD